MRHIVMALLGLALVLCASSDGTEPFQQPHSCGIVLRSDTEQVLDGIIYDVLYNPTFQEMRRSTEPWAIEKSLSSRALVMVFHGLGTMSPTWVVTCSNT